jgi:hypothetical protein
MKLSAKQAEEINKIILNEVKSAMQGRRDHEVLTKQGKLNEVAPSPHRIDKNIILDQLESEGYMEPGDFAGTMLTRYEQVIMKDIVRTINRHAVSHTGVDLQEIWDELADLDEDRLMDIQVTCVDDVALALRTYTEKLVEMIVAMVGGIDPDDR